MLRALSVAILAIWSCFAFAASESAMSLLDNRFRVDPTIEQITFLVYREQSSQPVVLVRPDGKKYYAWGSYDNVRWYQEPSLDIISVDNPMPGPWQAVGKVTPKNNIRLISHLKLSTDVFPNRLYNGEALKFTARLTSDDKPLVLRDFLDRVNLRVTFTKFVENEDELIKEARPVPMIIGEFSDDGRGLDEQAGDGVFTVQLPIEVEPGKYRARITSGNGVFLRAQEQVILVYPNPVSRTFIQSRSPEKPHQLVVSGEQGMIAPGSIAVNVEQNAPDGFITYSQGQVSQDGMKTTLNLDNDPVLGKYSWRGEIFATDFATQRALVFPIQEQTFSVVDEVDLEAARIAKEAELAEQRRIEMEKRIIAEREAERKRSMIIIAVGNVVMLLIAIVAWIVWRKLKAKRQAMPEMQLEVPKK
ncbi:TIGR03503 family protein [Vibrio parahaemolyticus]|uniref:TIGR03503 family protein n=5 Tax=Vibrio parahaemolyticus TaxID=670 RepID=Q87MG4_VIBPA|nr:TIGR03503 family protein [Vibrio parahaemolyticus]EFO37964.1 putative lipoprotein [Vibrio parahaemolyticus Peru-466]EFO44908.1 putative lipoprotein [Vibrio parahaemolyticus AQ4037]ARC19379.1 TIGR03503 family protein [Vibrio parahaemolyticus]AZV70233.1 TIGR03503 family protein [Vibrio parahaemolyticus]EDM60530.1 ferredoxin-dependent glutamate synthase [Vibrio parahaemolyticus AQ3810]